MHLCWKMSFQNCLVLGLWELSALWSFSNPEMGPNWLKNTLSWIIWSEQNACTGCAQKGNPLQWNWNWNQILNMEFGNIIPYWSLEFRDGITDLEFKIWNWNTSLEFGIKIWNWSLKLKFCIEVWKSKFEIWNWKWDYKQLQTYSKSV